MTGIALGIFLGTTFHTAADDRTREQGIAEAQPKLDTELKRLREIGPQLMAPWATRTR